MKNLSFLDFLQMFALFVGFVSTFFWASFCLSFVLYIGSPVDSKGDILKWGISFFKHSPIVAGSSLLLVAFFIYAISKKK
jgi:hypothetical protein